MMHFARDWRLAILIAYGVITAAAMVHMGQPQDGSWLLPAVGFWLFAMVPIVLLCFGKKHALAKTIGALIIAAVGAYAYIDTAWFAAGDAQAGLIFAALPIYQILAAVLWLAIVWIAGRLMARGNGDA